MWSKLTTGWKFKDVAEAVNRGDCTWDFKIMIMCNTTSSHVKKKVFTVLVQLCETLSTHNDSVACRKTFSINDLNWAFLCIFIGLVHHYGGFLAHLSLRCCFSSLRFFGICLYAALLRSCSKFNQVDFEWAVATHRFFSFSATLDRFAAVHGIIVLLHDPVWVMQGHDRCDKDR